MIEIEKEMSEIEFRLPSINDGTKSLTSNKTAELRLKYKLVSTTVSDFALLTGFKSSYPGSASARWYIENPWDNKESIDCTCVDSYGNLISCLPTDTSASIRPEIKIPEDDKLQKEIYDNEIPYGHGIAITIFGEYPQQAAPRTVQQILEEKYTTDSLNLTGRKYSFNASAGYDLKLVKSDEYEYDGQKFIRMISPTDVKLSNREQYNKGDYVWIEVSPINWVREGNKFVSEKGLVSGVAHCNKFGDSSENSYMHEFLEQMRNDIFQSLSLTKTEEVIDTTGETFPPDELKKAQEEVAKLSISVEKKEKLLAEYQRLISERKKLVERDKELDELINKKICELREGSSYGSKKQ